MKISVIALTALLSCSLCALAQQINVDSAPTVVDSGPNHRVWQTVSVDELGQTNVSSYTELATGLNYWNPAKGQYEESKEQFQIMQDGSAIATNGQHQVILAADINSGGSVDLLMPGGQRLQSNPMGLSFFDTASGKSVLIAEVTNCVGELVSPNVVLYTSAFGNLQAALRYTYTRDGFEQDVILYQNPGSPADYGLNPATSRLEMWSEFFNPPSPQASTQPLTDNITQDETLDFGRMRIGRGAAYVLNGQSLQSVEVAKSWQQVEGRQFLIESVSYQEIEPLVVSLQANAGNLKKSEAGKVTFSERGKLMAQAFKPRRKDRKVASIKPGRMKPGRGLVVDYVTKNSSQTNFTFLGDTTYFISGNVGLYGTNTVFEGGTVLKYTNNVTLTVNTPVTWQGSAYRPVVLTARDDPSVGESITPSNALSGYYATTALSIDANTANTNYVLQNLRVVNAQTAIAINGKSGHVLSHAQLVSCQNGIAATNADFSLRNALFDHVLTNFLGSSSTGRVEHLTADTAGWLNKDIGTNLYLTNCLLVSVTNTGSIGGSNTVYSTSSGSVFQSVGQGFHYLADNTYRDLGTTNINTSLAVDLKKMTTYPPLVLTNDFTVDTTLSPQAQRDTDTPDVGFHYDPLDYCWSGLNLTNSTLTLTNGVAIGNYGVKGTSMRTSGKFVSEGTPVNLNRLVRYQTVQEQPVLWGGVSSSMTLIYNSTTLPPVTLRFTDASVMAESNARRILYDATGSGANPLAIVHSQLRGIYESFPDQANATGTIFAWTNNLMERCAFSFTQSDMYHPFTLYLYNNLFHNGTESFGTTSNSPAWTVRDNLFDCDSVTKSGGPTFTVSNNGYRSGLTSLGGSNNKTGLVPDYQTGPLGNFYYPTTGSSTSLTNLFDAGSRNATNAGLYHFTTRIDLAKETNSTVEIGYHYVAPIARVVFIGTDTTTQGNWQGVYGADGYNVIQDSFSYPSYATVTPSGKSDYTWSTTTTDVRALSKASGSGRIAACWFSTTNFDIALTQSDFQPHRLAIYCLDWDPAARAQTIDIKDSTSGAVLDSQSVSSFSAGKYLVWDIIGNVNIRVTCTGGINAVVSGLFFSTQSPFVADSDGDGIPDYLEDRNGNGTVDSGETDPQVGSDAGLKVWITEPKSNATLP